MNELQCPYCDEEQSYPDDCNETERTYTSECENCGKNFVFITEYIQTFSSAEAPCLNGEEHNWQPIIGFPKEHFVNRFRCRYCDKEMLRK